MLLPIQKFARILEASSRSYGAIQRLIRELQENPLDKGALEAIALHLKRMSSNEERLQILAQLADLPPQKAVGHHGNCRY